MGVAVKAEPYLSVRKEKKVKFPYSENLKKYQNGRGCEGRALSVRNEKCEIP